MIHRIEEIGSNSFCKYYYICQCMGTLSIFCVSAERINRLHLLIMQNIFQNLAAFYYGLLLRACRDSSSWWAKKRALAQGSVKKRKNALLPCRGRNTLASSIRVLQGKRTLMQGCSMQGPSSTLAQKNVHSVNIPQRSIASTRNQELLARFYKKSKLVSIQMYSCQFSAIKKILQNNNGIQDRIYAG